MKKTITTLVFAFLISWSSAVQAQPPMTPYDPMPPSDVTGSLAGGGQVRITPANFRDVLGVMPDYWDLYYMIMLFYI